MWRSTESDARFTGDRFGLSDGLSRDSTTDPSAEWTNGKELRPKRAGTAST